MGQFSWIHLIYLLGVLLLISPMIAYVFRAPNALRNATIWLAILAGLGWAYTLSGGQFDQLINMPGQYQTSTPTAPLDESGGKAEDLPEDDNPIRNP